MKYSFKMPILFPVLFSGPFSSSGHCSIRSQPRLPSLGGLIMERRMTVTEIIVIYWMLFIWHHATSLHGLSYSIFTAGNVHYHPHFLDEETEAGQGEVTCQKYPSNKLSVLKSACGSVCPIPVFAFICSHSWPLSQVLGLAWLRGNCGYGDLLCVWCLVQIYILYHLLLTITLQDKCHCPYVQGKKTRG